VIKPSSSPSIFANQLRKLADRKETLDARRAANEAERQEIEDEDHEIRRLLAALGSQSSAPSITQAPEFDNRTRRAKPPPPGAQLQTIVRVLLEGGRLLRPEIFERLKPTGKAPTDLKQLSALLTRLKHSGHIGYDEDHRWFVKP
jgi:hypothetical protein